MLCHRGSEIKLLEILVFNFTVRYHFFILPQRKPLLIEWIFHLFEKKFHNSERICGTCSFFLFVKFSTFFSYSSTIAHIRAVNWAHFHQHFMSSFITQKFFLRNFYGITIWDYNLLGKANWRKKLLVKCWWNWQQGSTILPIFYE